MYTNQKEPCFTAQSLGVKTTYVVGFYNMNWVCQRVKDGLFIFELSGSLDIEYAKAKLYDHDICRKDVTWV